MKKFMVLCAAFINVCAAQQGQSSVNAHLAGGCFNLQPTTPLQTLNPNQTDNNIYVMLYATNLSQAQKQNALGIGMYNGIPHITLLVYPTNPHAFSDDLQHVVSAYQNFPHIRVNAYQLGRFSCYGRSVNFLAASSNGLLPTLVSQVDVRMLHQRQHPFVQHMTYSKTVPALHVDANNRILPGFQHLYYGWVFDNLQITTKVNGKYVPLFESN